MANLTNIQNVSDAHYVKPDAFDHSSRKKTSYLVIIEDDESKERHEDKDLDEDEEVVLVGHAPDDAPLLLAHPDHNTSSHFSLVHNVNRD